MSEIKFPKGIIVKRPHENAPNFVKAKLSIKRLELIEWLQNESDEWINLDLKNSKENKLYLQVDEWKPNQQNNNSSHEAPPPLEEEEEDSLPF